MNKAGMKISARLMRADNLLGFIKWSLVVLFVVFVLLLSVTYWVLTTERGFSSAIHLAETCMSGFSVAESQGDLFEGATIRKLRYRSDNITIQLQEVTTQIRWQSLFSFVIPIFSVDGLVVSVSEAAEEAPSTEPLSRIDLPITLDAPDIRLNDININVNGSLFTLSKLTAGLSFSQSLLTVTPSVASDILIRIAESEQHPQPSVHGQMSQSSNQLPQQFPHHIDPIKLQLATIVSPIDILIEQLDVLNVTLPQQDFYLRHLLLKAKIVESDVRLQHLDASTNKGNLEVKGSATLANDYPIDAHLMIDAPTTLGKNQHIVFNATGSLRDLSLTGELSGLSEGDFTARCQVLDKNLPFSLRWVSRYLQWPLVSEPAFTIEDNILLVKGSFADYRLSYQGKLDGSDVPKSIISLNAKGNLSEATVDALQLELLDGKVIAKGNLSWLDGLNANVGVELLHLRPEKQWPAFQGNVQGAFEATFEQTNEGKRQLHMTPDIEGELNDSPLLVKGDIDFHQPNLTMPETFALSLDNLTLLHGDNQIAIKGELSDQLSLSANLLLPDLNHSIPMMQGQIKGNIALAGSLKMPELTTDLDIDQVTLDNKVNIQRAKMKGNISLSESVQSDLRLSAQGLSSGDMVIEHLNSQLTGRPSAHQFDFDLTGNPLSWALSLTGSIANNEWKGQVNTSKGQFSHIPIVLQHPFTMTLAKGEVGLSPHCWSISTSPLCLTQPATVSSHGQLAITLKSLPIDALTKDLLPETTRLDAQVSANLDMHWQENQLPTIQGNITLPHGDISQKVNDGDVTIGWHNINVSVEGDKGDYRGRASIDFTDHATCDANIAYSHKDTGGSLDGSLTLHRLNLSRLEGFIPFYSTFKGFLNGHVNVTGEVTAPRLVGQVTIADIMATGPEAPVQFERGHAKLAFNQNKADLSVQLINQGTPLLMTADAEWKGEKQWSLDASVKSDNVQVKKTPVSSMKVVPNVQLSANQLGAMLKGQISVPEALIEVKKLPDSAVEVSSDEVLVVDKQSAPKKLNYPIDSKLLLSIGDMVKIDALGLKAKLTGKLFLKMKEGQPQLFGDLFIKEGTYRALAQSLIIQEGRILFNGPPDLPFLSIRAIRDPKSIKDDVIAGVQVSGAADQPQIDFFSEPAMPQQNIISYILTGKDIGEDLDANSAMTIMLISMGLSRSNKMMNDIGESIGIKDLSLNAEGGGDESQVTVSGYIAPNLQVKYGVGVFQAITEFTVRYELLKNLFLEAISSSEDSSLDLLYQFSFGGKNQKPVASPSLPKG